MPFVALLLGGVIGAAQLATMWGLVSSIVGPSIMDAAGWLLLIVPIGALLGIVAASFLAQITVSSGGWLSFLAAWFLATIIGFPAALVAPGALVGLGPDFQKYRFFAFVLEYGLAWITMFLLFKRKHQKL